MSWFKHLALSNAGSGHLENFEHQSSKITVVNSGIDASAPLPNPLNLIFNYGIDYANYDNGIVDDQQLIHHLYWYYTNQSRRGPPTIS